MIKWVLRKRILRTRILWFYFILIDFSHILKDFVGPLSLKIFRTNLSKPFVVFSTNNRIENPVILSMRRYSNEKEKLGGWANSTTEYFRIIDFYILFVTLKSTTFQFEIYLKWTENAHIKCFYTSERQRWQANESKKLAGRHYLITFTDILAKSMLSCSI